MPPKITFIGAGSTVFAKNLLGDILSYPELAEATITLMDIDPERLRTTQVVAERTAQALSARPKIEATLDRRLALDGADYVIAMFQIGGYKPGTVIDFELPKTYGLRQTIADTLGIGGIFRALRTIPVFLEITKEMEDLCPQATLLNYVNPMAMNTWAVLRSSAIQTVGLCHSVQGTAEQIARDIGVSIDEINYICAGINHMAFYLRFERKTPAGIQDLYPLIRQVVAEGRVPDWNRVRYEMLMRLGYFVTESSEHFAEYTPYFIKRDRPDLVEKFNVPLDEYITRCEVQLAGWEFMQHKIDHPSATRDELRHMMQEKAQANPYLTPEFIEWTLRAAEEFESGKIVRSHEYGSGIIHAIETGEPRVVYGNVRNHGLIDNLPQGCCVEVPVLVDKNGLQPVKVGALPPQLAAMMQTNINVQSLTVEAALTRKKEHIYHAAMLDPHTAAELDLEQIWSLVDDLIAAHEGWLPEYD
jgi:alpha-galactosidase